MPFNPNGQGQDQAIIVNGTAGHDIMFGGSGTNAGRGGSGADTIRGNVGDLGLDQVVGFQLGQDRIQFGTGLLAGDIEDAFLVFNSGAGSLLVADTVETGWEAIATFGNISVGCDGGCDGGFGGSPGDVLS